MKGNYPLTRVEDEIRYLSALFVGMGVSTSTIVLTSSRTYMLDILYINTIKICYV